MVAVLTLSEHRKQATYLHHLVKRRHVQTHACCAHYVALVHACPVLSERSASAQSWVYKHEAHLAKAGEQQIRRRRLCGNAAVHGRILLFRALSNEQHGARGLPIVAAALDVKLARKVPGGLDESAIPAPELGPAKRMNEKRQPSSQCITRDIAARLRVFCVWLGTLQPWNCLSTELMITNSCVRRLKRLVRAWSVTGPWVELPRS